MRIFIGLLMAILVGCNNSDSTDTVLDVAPTAERKVDFNGSDVVSHFESGHNAAMFSGLSTNTYFHPASKSALIVTYGRLNAVNSIAPEPDMSTVGKAVLVLFDEKTEDIQIESWLASVNSDVVGPVLDYQSYGVEFEQGEDTFQEYVLDEINGKFAIHKGRFTIPSQRLLDGSVEVTAFSDETDIHIETGPDYEIQALSAQRAINTATADVMSNALIQPPYYFSSMASDFSANVGVVPYLSGGGCLEGYSVHRWALPSAHAAIYIKYSDATPFTPEGWIWFFEEDASSQAIVEFVAQDDGINDDKNLVQPMGKWVIASQHIQHVSEQLTSSVSKTNGVVAAYEEYEVSYRVDDIVVPQLMDVVGFTATTTIRVHDIATVENCGSEPSNDH
ncbi:hypothetical protein [Thaumasiovibrio subtropicus]|uniref:hypothetical protein n=1 Tax=Thaumasiovibrio subtropicus TaxID=1891207 RepID=UPI000B350A2C|nr:hypothetical protein [Thaumasiovibrio subtropicus]